MKKLNQGPLASFAVAVLLSIGATSFAADNSSPTDGGDGTHQKRHGHFHKEMKKVFESCAKANGVTLPAKGSGDQLNSGDRTAVRACMKQVHETMHTCLQNAGVSRPARGQKPSDATKAAFKSCQASAVASIGK